MTREYVGIKTVTAWEEERAPVAEAGEMPGLPEPGYAVKYEGGFISWSPKDVFEEAYRPSGELDFGMALFLLKRRARVARRGWNGKGMWLAIQWPDARSKMGLPYIFMSTVDGRLVPWLASQTDMLAEDWEIVPPI